jgi:small-conductance mechanosensitive channel
VTVLKGDRWFRAQGPVFAVALLVLVIAGGTVGYMLTDGHGPWAAFYMTVLALTTVESPSHLSRAGQAFTVVLLLGGVGSALYTFTLLATVVFEGGLPKRLQRRRHQRGSDRERIQASLRRVSADADPGVIARSVPAVQPGLQWNDEWRP